MNDRITSFRDQNHFLSNFFPCDIEMDGFYYLSTESAFQAAKSLKVSERARFIGHSAADAKKNGQRLLYARTGKT